MLEAAGFTVHVGGNIGTPLLDQLDVIGPGDKVVMELSSFQLELFDRSPAIAAILNITPNHLDRHPSMNHYAAAKANILRFQTRGDTCVLNADDAYTGPWLRSGRCTISEGNSQPAVYFPIVAIHMAFSMKDDAPAGALLHNEQLIWRRPGQEDEVICRAAEVQLRGRGLPDDPAPANHRPRADHHRVRARADEVDRVLGLEMGADDYVVKPSA